jgi:membrane-associated phospholipid phosphatase
MQYLDYKTETKWQVSKLTQYFLLVGICLLVWLSPATHPYCAWLDAKTFEVLNSSLLYSNSWQLLWGYLNHPNESWLNVIFLAMINIIGIYSLPRIRRRKAVAGVIYFWLFFELVLLFTNKFFSGWLGIHRDSPSLVITPWVLLTESLNIASLKISSTNSFPAGHALVLIFWAKFTMLYSKPWVHKLVWLTVLVLILPRLFSGAHWLSDVIFTVCYALLWFEVAAGTPLFGFATRNIEKLIGDKK